MNAERDCKAHDGEQRTDTEPTRRGAQVIPEQAPVEAQRERQTRCRMGPGISTVVRLPCPGLSRQPAAAERCRPRTRRPEPTRSKQRRVRSLGARRRARGGRSRVSCHVVEGVTEQLSRQIRREAEALGLRRERVPEHVGLRVRDLRRFEQRLPRLPELADGRVARELCAAMGTRTVSLGCAAVHAARPARVPRARRRGLPSSRRADGAHDVRDRCSPSAGS